MFAIIMGFLYVCLCALAIYGAFYVKKTWGQILAVLAVGLGCIAWMILSKLPEYEDLARNGIQAEGLIIDYSLRENSQKGSSYDYTFVVGKADIRRISLAERRFEIGEAIPVLYSKNGEGCLVGADKGSSLQLLKYGTLNGQCFKIREDLVATYKSKLDIQE